MDIAAEKAFDALCKVTGVRDHQIGLVRHGWIAALNWRCPAPSASANKPSAPCPKCMDINRLKNDIDEGLKLLSAVNKSSAIIGELSLSSLADAEVIKRAEAIHWSLLMYRNDIAEMLRQWREELSKAEK